MPRFDAAVEPVPGAAAVGATVSLARELQPFAVAATPADDANSRATANRRETLRRWPDVEAPELQAWDAADTLILDEAAPLLHGAEVIVIGDDYGALTLGALDRGAVRVRVHQDSLAGELALRANAEREGSDDGDGSAAGLGEDRPPGADARSAEHAASRFAHHALALELVGGARLVLLRLPRSLDALDEIAALIAQHAHPEVVVIAGGRLKHMTVSMNEVLQRHFGRLDVSLARQKSRLLIAREPIPGEARQPRQQFHVELGLTVVGTGGVFAGTSIDIGTRALLFVLDQVAPFDSAIDLGCGTGILAATLKRARPSARVLATDQSAAAVASARLTMAANDLDVVVTRDDALSQQPDASVDLVVLNPPFHSGAAVHPGVSTKLFEAAARVLKPGGELWAVWNSHLAYRPTLERIVGPTRQVARTPKFTITASTRARASSAVERPATSAHFVEMRATVAAPRQPARRLPRRPPQPEPPQLPHHEPPDQEGR